MALRDLILSCCFKGHRPQESSQTINNVSHLQGQEQSRMETSGLAEEADVLEECASSSAVTPNFGTPMQSHSSCSDHTSAEAAPSPFYSTRIEGLSELRTKCENQLEFDVESSKSHWTELSAATSDSDDSDVQVQNRVVFEMMMEHPLWGPLFRREPCDLIIGAKIGEGGQAEVFEAYKRVAGTICSRPLYVPEDANRILVLKVVLKVFKKGYSLVDLQRSWPQALASARFPQIPYGDDFLGDIVRRRCFALGVHLMDDGRFAFIFHRHWGDLRKLIDERMLESNGCPPFDDFETFNSIFEIAQGMCELHKMGILHNDLKTANVLVPYRDQSWLAVADFECSGGTVGTGFWRAPEVLFALKNRNLKRETFTQKSDVYSFAMTCYEIITGCMPFEGHDGCDYDIILRGERPTLPSDHPYSMFNDLVTRCWHQDPQERPSFVEILEDLKALTLDPLSKVSLSSSAVVNLDSYMTWESLKRRTQ